MDAFVRHLRWLEERKLNESLASQATLISNKELERLLDFRMEELATRLYMLLEREEGI